MVLDGFLKDIGFVKANSDPCIYITSGGEPLLLGVYVDDIALASKSCARLEEVKKVLAQKVDIKGVGKLNHFLGMQEDESGKIWIGQQAYVESVLQKFGMELAKPCCYSG